MEPEDHDIELRLRLNTIKCERFKTLREDPPNKKYLLREGYDSFHVLKILTDDNDLDKANQVNNQVPVEEEEEAEEEEEEKNEEELAKEELFEEYEEELEYEEVEEKELKETNIKKRLKEAGENNAAKGDNVPETDHEKETDQEKETEQKELANKKEDVLENIDIEGIGVSDAIEGKVSTGLFRDGLKRIDIVLVVQDNASSNTDKLKLDFLCNILRIGLEVEVEPGLLEIHKHLCFIKVHAPESILKEYGDLFAVKRHFFNTHMASIRTSERTVEMDWLKTIRSNYTTPDGYSNYERSLIVFKILRHLPFGEHVNQYGLHDLLNRNIILNAYALHDGPYFYVPNQKDSGANARQILYYNWAGLQNAFKFQPLHVIHEYFGPKIAFYYAFYGLYNIGLIIPSIAGVISWYSPYLNPDEKINILNFTCVKPHIHDKYTICPVCQQPSCHVRDIKEFCKAMDINISLDYTHVFYYFICITTCTLGFITFWRRKEYVLNWVWELGGRDSYYETSRRPEFNVDYKNPRKSARSGYKYDESKFYPVLRTSLSLLHTVLCFIASLALITESRKLSRKVADSFQTENTKPPVLYEYAFLAVYQTIYTLFTSALEFVFHSFIYYYLVNFENHKSNEAYEKSLVMKQFEFSITLIFPFMMYYAWVEGSNNAYYGVCHGRYVLPILRLFATFDTYLHTPWHQLRMVRGYKASDCYNFCFPFTCIMEVGVLVSVMVFFKQVMFRVMFNNYGLTTDYNLSRKINENIPWWEREYKLGEFNDATLNRQFMTLALQFALVTFFVVACPFAPLVVLVVNVWDMRHSAKKLLLATRRPLLIRRPGIGVWNTVFSFTAYASVLINALNMVLLTKVILRYKQRHVLTEPLTWYAFEYLFPFESLTSGRVAREEKCRAPYILYNPEIHHENKYRYKYLDENWSSRPDVYLIQYLRFRLIVYFVFGMICYALIVEYIFGPYRLRSDIEKTREIENRIKGQYTYYDVVENKNVENVGKLDGTLLT